MTEYDFLNLSPYEFELLCRDLLQKYYGVFLESFTPGRDKGIDLRYMTNPENSLIIQCKRFSNFPDLCRILQAERKKLGTMGSLSRYVLATSVPVSYTHLTLPTKRIV